VRAATRHALTVACGAVGLLWGGLAWPQDLARSEIQARLLRGNLQVLLGYGGNIAVSSGPDGTLLVDDEYAALTTQVRAALAQGLSEDEVVALHPAQGFAMAGRGTDRWVRVAYREYDR
jgi:hypothetical protein